jgi:hypothetical protein
MVAALTYTILFSFFHCFSTFVSLLCSFFVSCNIFLTITSLPSSLFCNCFQMYVSLYFSSLLCLSSYCTCNPLRASVSMFLSVVLWSFSSVNYLFLSPLCFSLMSSDFALQFHLLLVGMCFCFFSSFSSFSSVYLISLLLLPLDFLIKFCFYKNY